MAENLYDLTIIGGGPVGMYGAFYGGIQGLKIKLVDSLEALGGQLTATYPEKFIYDLPGHQEIRAAEFIKQLQTQMDSYKENIDIVLGATVLNVDKQEDGTFNVETSTEKFASRAVLITAGNGSFTPRPLGVENDAFNNLHYFVTDMTKFKDRHVVIFGGGDSAVDWANMLEPIAASVSIVHRRNEFRAHAGNVEEMKASSVKVYTPYVPASLEGADGVATEVVIKNAETEELTTLPADDVIVLFGFVSSLGPIKEWGIELNKTALKVDNKFATSTPGIFAAGDAASFDGKIKMITAGFGEAVVAANAARAYAYPDKVVRHQHSSNIKK